MIEVRGLTLETADVVLAALRDPGLEAAWSNPSSLPRLSVAGLAGHLAGQVLNIERVLASTHGDSPILALMDHYARAVWIGAPLDDPVNVHVRTEGERLAADGPHTLALHVAQAIARLRQSLPAEPEDRTVLLPWTGWRLSLDDFLVTRMLEMTVHLDDLAASAPVSMPATPEAAAGVVLDLLVRLAVRRHGTTAVLRALSRSERAPASIAAI